MRKISVQQFQKMEGASNSLKLSIREIEAHLAGKGIAAPGAVRADLHAALAEFAAHWYRRGFNRGHRESYGQYKMQGAVPKALRMKVKRDLFGGNTRKLRLKSRIK